MSNKSIFCLAHTKIQADQIVNQLKIAKFSNKHISALFFDRKSGQDFAHEQKTHLPRGTAEGAGTGLIIGGALGWIAGIGAMAIPGVGPFIAAGPIISALSGIAVGAAVGGIAGGLISLGITEVEAKHYEAEIKKGRILISVHTESSDQINLAKAIFDKAGAKDVRVIGEEVAAKVESKVKKQVDSTGISQPLAASRP